MNGDEAERRALQLLEQRGLSLIVRNWRCRAGELDLVMRDGDAVVVAEVRSRARSDFGAAAETVDARKQRKLVAAARLFLSARPDLADRALRFDVVALDGPEKIEWLQGAFEVGEP
jgi:putative endonuclease